MVMASIRIIYPLYLLALTLFVAANSFPFELSVIEQGSGFFMRPFQPWRGNHSVWEWPMVALAGAQSVRASYGSIFSQQVELPSSLLRQVAAGRSAAVSFRVVEGIGDVTAHFVTESISSDRRLVQVLFHVRRTTIKQEGPLIPVSPGRVCVLLYVRRNNGDELATSCVISEGDVCIAELLLPWRWWDQAMPSVPRMVSAFFSAFRTDDGDSPSSPQCDVNRYPPLRRLPADDAATFVHQVSLVDGSVTYQTLREDQHVLLRIPVSTYHPGSRFTVAVQLQADSKLSAFSVKVKCRVGVRVIGVENRNSSRWRVTFDLNAKRQTATVAAYNLQYNNSVATSATTVAEEVADVFDWVFEVIEADAVRDDTGRLAFTIEYELPSSVGGATRRHVENKVSARVQIQPDTTFAIIPVVKTTEIVNTAMLSGLPQTYPMTVYSVSHAGRVADVTSQATCHAGSEDVLQVSESCGFVFLDGTETSGSSTASIIVKYGRHARFIHFHVWSPELPLTVELSDTSLGRVVGWAVPQIVTNSTLIVNLRNSSSVDQTTDSMLSNLDDLDSMQACRPLYQSATVDVYARFVTADSAHGSPPYMLHRKAVFRLTDLVRDRIQLSNGTVARLRSEKSVIDGLRPGRSEIQVVSRSGRVLGTGELSVVDDTVIIDHMEVDLVSGVELSLDSKLDFPGAIAAQLTKIKRLYTKHQEAVVEVSLKFDDGTSLPLTSLSPTDYQLVIESLDPDVIATDSIAPTHSGLVVGTYPRIIAMATGQGDLVQVTLLPTGVCHAASKPSAVQVSTVRVEVELADNPEQSDARVGSSDSAKRKTSEAWGGKERSRINGSPVSRGSGRIEGGSSPGKDSVLNHEPQVLSGVPQELRRTTSLELAMYVLLGVFGVVLAIFAINCAVFLMRRKKRGGGRGGKDTGSSTADADWIWIGHDALKRNAIGIECMRTLMPDADFGDLQTNAVVASTVHGFVACVADSSSSPPPPLPPKMGRPLSASLGLVRRGGSGAGPRSITNTMESKGVPNKGHGQTAPQDAGGVGGAMSWHGRSSRSGTTSDIEWECAKLGVTSNDDLMAYFDGLRESAA